MDHLLPLNVNGRLNISMGDHRGLFVKGYVKIPAIQEETALPRREQTRNLMPKRRTLLPFNVICPLRFAAEHLLYDRPEFVLVHVFEGRQPWKGSGRRFLQNG